MQLQNASSTATERIIQNKEYAVAHVTSKAMQSAEEANPLLHTIQVKEEEEGSRKRGWLGSTERKKKKEYIRELSTQKYTKPMTTE